MSKIPPSITEYGRLERDEYFQYLKLLNEAKEQGFSTPKELSEFINENKLGYKYPDIAGVITMTNNSGSDWKFKGGISPKIYKYLCFDLGFSQRGNNFSVKGFKSYRDT